MKVINIIVPGIAVSKLRARKGKNGNFYTPKKLSDYQEAVGWTAKEQMMRQEVTAFEKDVPLFMTIAFVKKGKLTGRPDVDNLAKSILDSLSHGIAFQDDSQIVKLFAAKVNPRNGEPIGVAIRIQEAREKE
jgi:Holliday junction resolvase RusA-like endonuclease